MLEKAIKIAKTTTKATKNIIECEKKETKKRLLKKKR